VLNIKKKVNWLIVIYNASTQAKTMTSLANSLFFSTTQQKNDESGWLVVIYNTSTHSYDILGAGMLWKPKEARILTNFIDQPVNIW